MNKVRYSIKHVSKHTGMFWAVFEGRKELAVFQFKSEAEDYAQRCVADDAWEAANCD